MHLKVFVKLKKTLKTLSSGQKNPKKPKKKPKNPQKNQKNPLGWVFKKKTRVFSNPVSVQGIVLTMFIILPSSNECKAYLTLAPFTVVSACI